MRTIPWSWYEDPDVARRLAKQLEACGRHYLDAPISGVTKPVACVVARPGVELQPDELIAYGSQRLPAHLVPAEIRLVPDLPRNVNAKLMRRRLRQIWEEMSTARRGGG